MCNISSLHVPTFSRRYTLPKFFPKLSDFPFARSLFWTSSVLVLNCYLSPVGLCLSGQSRKIIHEFTCVNYRAVSSDHSFPDKANKSGIRVPSPYHSSNTYWTRGRLSRLLTLILIRVTLSLELYMPITSH